MSTTLRSIQFLKCSTSGGAPLRTNWGIVHIRRSATSKALRKLHSGRGAISNGLGKPSLREVRHFRWLIESSNSEGAPFWTALRKLHFFRCATSEGFGRCGTSDGFEKAPFREELGQLYEATRIMLVEATIEDAPNPIRTIAQIVAAALAQDRAQNQTPPASSSQPVVEERQIPEPVSGNQASVGNTVPVENDVIKQLAELKDRIEKMSVVKEKDPVTNFHITEYVLHPTSSTSFKTFKHTTFEGDKDPYSHLSEFLRVSQMNRNVESSNQNQSVSSNTVGAVNERVRREFTDLGRPLSTVLRPCIKNGILLKLLVDPTKPVHGRYMDRNYDYHQCKGHLTDECFKLRHDIQDLIDSGKITKPSERNKPSTKNNPLPQYPYNYPPRKSQSCGSINAIGSGLPEEVVLAEAEWEERMCAMLNIWDDCNSDEEGKMPVKIEIEKSITVKVDDVLEDEDDQIQLAIQKSLVDQEEQWYYSSEEDVNEVGVQSLTRSGRVYNPDSSVQAKGKEIAADGIKKKATEKGREEPKEKKKQEEVVKVQKKTVEVENKSRYFIMGFADSIQRA
ncbi:hypothetical protein JCGZ_25480 [Jatropha curcas]|uniref:Uncharacterized protein n=1 Tax=Jatropha curcas TaxID=180498 RepID=A0A067JLL0_JATCU|nr:hypothetical protein JCGZ_25480 [Jatropha curcas]